jgi:formamidopyrimidine-DNA glycosylase
MTGKWIARPPGGAAERFERARLDAGRVSVRYVDPRRFGRLCYARDGAPPAAWRALGPDPLTDGVDAARLHQKLSRTHRAIKEALLDQRIAAGVGNIQATEALWRARLDPRRPADAIDRRAAAALGRAILASIRATLAREDGPEITYVEEPGADNPFKIYGRAGEPCPRCRARLARIVQSGRATVFCPRCQRA